MKRYANIQISCAWEGNHEKNTWYPWSRGGKPPGEVYVEKLFPNLWAEKQGIQLKDVLEELNGQKVSTL